MPARWCGRLELRYRLQRGRSVVHDRHEGPLRVLQPLYPEGPAVCHQVLLHPPGGIVGGDELHVDAALEAGAHALVTTPGATKFYRSDGAPALQRVALRLEAGARLEWLPLETIAYRECDADSRLQATLAPGAEMIGRDVLALGLPASGQPFDAGRLRQSVHVRAAPHGWLERGCIAGDDALLLRAGPGLAGCSVIGLMWFGAGQPLGAARRDALLQAARDVAPADGVHAAVTAAQPHVLVHRALAQRVEPLMQLQQRVWLAWREHAWGLRGTPPRIWRT